MAKKQSFEDLETALKLVERDPIITEEFFFKECSDIFYYIISYFYSEENDWEAKKKELINQFYLYVMETKALHKYRGESSLKTYLRQVAYNYFKRLADKDQHRKIAEAKFFSQEQLEVMLATERESLKSNVRKGIAKMKDERNAFIIQKMFVDDFTKGEIMFELNVEKGSHFDVLKNRAKKEFARCYLELKNE